MHVAAWCGSLAAASSNAAAIEVAERRVRESGHEVVHVTHVELIPAFRPELVDDPGAAVAELRRTLEGCDALLLSAPEYAGGAPGSLKNALDWLVGSASVYQRPVGVLSVGTTGGEHALEQLVRTLSWQGALVVAVLGIASPRTKMSSDGRFTDAPTIAAIEQWADRVVEAASATPARRLEMVSGAVARYGIDPARFGTLDR